MEYALFALTFFWPASLLLLGLSASIASRLAPRQLGWLIPALHVFAVVVDGLAVASLLSPLGFALLFSRLGVMGFVLGALLALGGLGLGAFIAWRLWTIRGYRPDHLAAYLATWGA